MATKSMLDRMGEAISSIPDRISKTVKDAAPPKDGATTITRTRVTSLPDDTVVNPNAKRPSPTTYGLPGRQRDENTMNAVDAQSEGRAPGEGMKKGGKTKGGAGGLGALAALQGAMAGAGGGAGGPPMGPPPGAGGPPPMGPPPGAGGPPPGMKRGGHVKKMNEGGRPHEDEPLRQASRKAKELTTEKGIQKEEKASSKGGMKYAKGGSVGDETYHRGNHFGGDHGHGTGIMGKQKQGMRDLNIAHSDHSKSVKMFAKGGVVAKGRALDKADGGDAKEEKGNAKGDFKYAKGGRVFSAHGSETKGKTRGRYI